MVKILFSSAKVEDFFKINKSAFLSIFCFTARNSLIFRHLKLFVFFIYTLLACKSVTYCPPIPWNGITHVKYSVHFNYFTNPKHWKYQAVGTFL